MTRPRLLLAGVAAVLLVLGLARPAAALVVPPPTPACPVPTGPAVPGAPATATPLAAPSCRYVSVPGVPGVGGIVGAVSGPVFEVVLATMVHWVAAGAQSLLSGLAGLINDVTAPDLGASWFKTHYLVMTQIAVLLVLPLLLAAAITAIVRQDGRMLVRTVTFHLPLAVIGTFLATQLVALALGITDQLCFIVLHDDKDGTTRFLSGMGTSVDGLATHSSVAGFAVVVVAVVLIVGALALFLELLMRTSAIYVAMLFLPIVLAGLVWPPTLRWARRLIELLAVLILSKFIIVAVLSLAASALASGLASPDLAALLTGASLLLLAAFAPFTLLRLAPVVEGAAANHLEGLAPALPGRAGAAAQGQRDFIRRLLPGDQSRPDQSADDPSTTAGILDSRKDEGAARVGREPSAGAPYIADSAAFDASRGAAASGPVAAVAVAGRLSGAVQSAPGRAASVVDGLSCSTGDGDGD